MTTFSDWVVYGVGFSIAGMVVVVAIGQFKEEFARVIQDMQNTFKTLRPNAYNLKTGYMSVLKNWKHRQPNYVHQPI